MPRAGLESTGSGRARAPSPHCMGPQRAGAVGQFEGVPWFAPSAVRAVLVLRSSCLILRLLANISASLCVRFLASSLLLAPAPFAVDAAERMSFCGEAAPSPPRARAAATFSARPRGQLALCARAPLAPRFRPDRHEQRQGAKPKLYHEGYLVVALVAWFSREVRGGHGLNSQRSPACSRRGFASAQNQMAPRRR